jgi:hypothetical protein
MNTYNENLKSAIYRIFDDQNFEEKFEVEFKKITESLHSKEETLWIAEEMARNGKVEEAMKIVNFFVQQFYGSCNNFIDVELSKLDLKIKNGDEVNYVATPKAVLPYVLSAVISTLDTKYYKRVLSIIDDIFSKENSLFVKRNTLVPLAGFAVNIYAKSGSFSFEQTDRNKVEKIAFDVLNTYHDYPRILEYLTDVFGRFFLLNSEQANEAILKLVYSDVENKKFNPDYVLENLPALIIYYAEFRVKRDYSFNSQPFIILLQECLRQGSARFKTTIIWNFWKFLEEVKDGDKKIILKKFVGYISICFDSTFEYELVDQIYLFLDKIFFIDKQESIELFQKMVDYIKKGVSNKHSIWLSSTSSFLPKVAQYSPNELIECINLLVDLHKSYGVYVGDFKEIFNSYIFSLEDKREGLRLEVEKVENSNSDLLGS